ncbi:MAG TPA: FAD-dependent oxidoreductase [Candidatus Saccharimonadales bacterium]|jgi:ferredoxin-NADP reductase|nr:FAD-dependent oxidoreductase [Candidatus Saccharimonadales bacterium]
MNLTLASKEHLVDNVWAFRFTSSEPLTWTPGQFIYVELPHDHPDEQGTKRWFTVSSAPYEGFLQITTRVTDSTFKQDLAALPIGGELPLIDKPDGDFIWENVDKPLVFVAGGIGITPFYSILKQRVHDGQPIPVTLLYGGRTPDVPFKNEIEAWTKDHSEFTVQYIIGEPLTAQKIGELVPDLHDSLLYVSGPEPMVEKLGDGLRASDMPDAQLKQDFFPNYTVANY